MQPPVFILAPPRSFTSVVCAMLGQNPKAYGLPETQLFTTDTMLQWCWQCKQTSFPVAHGLLRVVAELYFGGQTDRTIALAQKWIEERIHFSTSWVFATLAEKVRPKVVLEKSPSFVYEMDHMERTRRDFPNAKYVHLVRHPRGFCESVLKSIRNNEENAPLTPVWAYYLATYPDAPTPEIVHGQVPLDPQRAWLCFQRNVDTFLRRIPEERKLHVRGEDLLTDPEKRLVEVAQWLGLRTDAEAVEQMKHPEDSPYAGFGPKGAMFGNDPNFLRDPKLRPERGTRPTLDGPLSWRKDGQGFLPEVRQLARQFGYD
ncbi:MAG: sulfotransferase [Acidobacteria bacterium]|nr:sulfotransferase [Acidobacteriota bacterium]